MLSKRCKAWFLFYIFTLYLLAAKFVGADTIRIDFTADDFYSIDVGGTIDWLPKNKGHNLEFLAAPYMSELPEKSDLDVRHRIIFELPGVYLYHCTPHGNMGILGLIVVGNNLENIKKI